MEIFNGFSNKNLSEKTNILTEERKSFIKNNLSAVFENIKNGNNYGEPVTLVAASKLVDVPSIEYALSLGVKILGDNKAQEFRDKTSFIKNADFHFIGRLQQNKLKYVVGKVSLIQSVDSVTILEAIDKESEKKNVISNVLLEINSGEKTKAGFPMGKIYEAVKEAGKYKNVSVCGFMSMLPDTDDITLKEKLCLQLRKIYDTIKADSDESFKYLSVGMSGDYKTAVSCGSNTIRLGSAIFGKRSYNI